MKLSLRPDVSRLLLAFFLLFVLFLSSAYLGGPLKGLYYFYAAFLCIDFLHLAWSVRNIYHYQNFSTSIPVRGQTVEYQLTLHNQSLVPGCRTRFALTKLDAVRQEFRADLDRDFFLGSDNFHNRDYTLHCLFRGVYALGLSNIQLMDMLSLATATLPVIPETLHILPRLVELKSCRLYTGSEADPADQPADGAIEDYTRFRDLGEYSPGANVRHLDWKRFAAWGRPVIRRFDSSASLGLSIYLDRKHTGPDCPEEREVDDCSIEVALAASLFHLRLQVPVHIRLEDGFVHLDSDGLPFQQFLLSTVHIRFAGAAEPGGDLIGEFEQDRRSGTLPTSTVLGIFRRFDHQSLSFLEDCSNQQGRTMAVVITTLLDQTAIQEIQSYRMAHRLEDRLFLVRGSASIRDDLS
jgi:uncharacterized protein (DUF58 family)